jgi:hypothetical protein
VGFVSLLSGFLDPSGALPNAAPASNLPSTGATLFGLSQGAAKTVGIEKRASAYTPRKAANRIAHEAGSKTPSAASGKISSPLVFIEGQKSAQHGILPGESSANPLPLAVAAFPSAALPAESSDATNALSSLHPESLSSSPTRASSGLSSSLALSNLSRNGVPSGSAHDLAFALQLTWQAPADDRQSAANLPLGPLGAAESGPTRGTVPGGGAAEGMFPLAVEGEDERATAETYPLVRESSAPSVSGASGPQSALGGSVKPVFQGSSQRAGAESPGEIPVSKSKVFSALENRAGGMQAVRIAPASTESFQALLSQGPLCAESPSDVDTTFPRRQTAAPTSRLSPAGAARALPPIDAMTPNAAEGEQASFEPATSRPPSLAAPGMIPAPGMGVPVGRSDRQPDTGSGEDSTSDSGARTLGAALATKSSRTETSHEQPVSVSAPAFPLFQRASGDVEAPAKSPGAQPPTAPAPAREIEPAAPPPSQPLREVSLRVAVPSSTPVDVQVAERGGKVQVAVRTADQDLARSLQNNLGDLVGRLQDKGFKTDVWTPVAVQHGGLAVRESSTFSGNASEHPGSQGGQPETGSGGQRQSGQRQQGHWKAQLEQMLSLPEIANETAA